MILVDVRVYCIAVATHDYDDPEGHTYILQSSCVRSLDDGAQRKERLLPSSSLDSGPRWQTYSKRSVTGGAFSNKWWRH